MWDLVEKNDMRALIIWRGVRVLLLTGAVAVGAMLMCQTRASAVDASPFDKLVGRWVGEGRLGVRDNATESVKCRVTYIRSDAADQLKQTIRCASAGGSIEVQSLVTHAAGTLTGSWMEQVRNLSGELRGTVTPRGFRVNVKGESLNANMDIVILGAKQVIEIQFINSSLIGLTLILERG